MSALQIRTGRKDNIWEKRPRFCGEAEGDPRSTVKGSGSKAALESEKVLTIQEAVDAVGISRSSFYKYKDDIFPFHDNSQGTTITLTFQMDENRGYCRMC